MLVDHRTQATGQRIGRRATVGERGVLVREHFNAGQRSHGHPDRDDTDDRARGDDRGSRLDPVHGKQNKAKQRVGGKDVALEQQHRMQAAEHEKPAEPADEPRGEVRTGCLRRPAAR
ncbi:hypothetical protein LUX34_33755 [Streptomyces werraensis]|nr:hypothetical protein [Streptomyces werraensis]